MNEYLYKESVNKLLYSIKESTLSGLIKGIRFGVWKVLNKNEEFVTLTDLGFVIKKYSSSVLCSNIQFSNVKERILSLGVNDSSRIHRI